MPAPLPVIGRHASYASIALAIAVSTELGLERWLAVAVIALAWFGAAELGRRMGIQGWRAQLPRWLEAGANIAVVAIAPELLPVVAVATIGQTASTAIVHGPEAALPAVTVMLAGYAAAVVVYGLGFGPALLISVGGVSVAVLGAAVKARMSGDRRQYDGLLAGLEAVVWEALPGYRRFTFVSARSMDMLGFTPADVTNNWAKLIHPDDHERERAAFLAGLDAVDQFVLDYRIVTADQRTLYVRDHIRVERDAEQRPVRLYGIITDVTRQQEAEATIRRQAQYDALTGLPNRQLFNESLRRMIEGAQKAEEGVAVLLLDLNGFKEVNDTLGHAVGDQLLQAIAGRLGAYLPDRAMVARLGGDEFAILMSPAAPQGAAALADTVAACLQPPITIDDMQIQAGASTGIALYPSDGETPAALLRRADAAMYEAKQAGRSYVFATPEDDKTSVRRLQLLGELRASLATGDFVLYHQPKIDLKSGRIVGTEGLIRWRHRQFGILTPHEFIELSELSGLIQPLTRWLVEEGVRQVRRWKDSGLDLAVALNLSVRNFFDQGMPAFIAGLLNDYQVPGDQIVLEITEREVMADRALARNALDRFRALGVRISIDDFGTGYSSLSQLQQLPIDEMKVDASFVAGMVDNQQDAVIVRSIIDLGHNLGLEVVAEGVETTEQLKALRMLGCDRAQGYLISRPLPPQEFTDWLRTRATRTDAPSPASSTGVPAVVASARR